MFRAYRRSHVSKHASAARCTDAWILAILLIVAAPAAQGAWETTRFKLVPEERSVLQTPSAIVGKTLQGLEELITSAEPGLSSDKALADAAWARLVEAQLHDIATRYSAAGLLEPAQLEKSEDGSRYIVRLFDFSRSAHIVSARYSGFHRGGWACQLGDSWIALNLDHLRFESSEEKGKGPAREASARQESVKHLYNLLAHELFHAIQCAYNDVFSSSQSLNPMVNSSKAQIEGTATAVAALVSDQRFGSFIAETTSPIIQGRWNYTRPFVAALNDDGYLTSSFWRFLMERHGGIGLMDDLFREQMKDMQVMGSEHVLEWLDRGLRRSNRVRLPLYLVFPEFATELSSWGNDLYLNVSDQRWNEDVLAGCEEAELSPEDAEKPFELTLGPVTSLCLAVVVRGLAPNQQFSVNFMAQSATIPPLDSLHLGIGRMGAVTALGGSFNCYSEGRKMSGRGQVACLDKPYLGRREQRLGSSWNCAAARTAAEKSVCSKSPVSGESEQYVKAWFAEHQEFRSSDRLKNYYVFSRIDPRPTLQGEFETYSMRVALELGSLRNSETGDSVKPEFGINTPINPGPGPMGAGSVIGSPAQLGLDAFSQLAFAQLGPQLDPNSVASEASEQGIGLVHAADRDFANLSDEEAEGTNMFQVVFEQPIKFGQTGTVAAQIALGHTVGAYDPNQFIRAEDPDQANGTAKITRFDDGLLAMDINAGFCRVGNVNPSNGRCLKRELLSAKFIKPFGWMYDGNQRFVSIDSPGMEEYRNLVKRAMGGQTGMTATRPLETPNQGQTPTLPSIGEALGNTQQCDCSCEEFGDIQKFGEEMATEAGVDPNGIPNLSNPGIGKVMCVMQCMQAYMVCENQ